MLSLHNISSAGQAESYYKTVNDYYAGSGDPESKQEEDELQTDEGEHLRSAFEGRGAELLDLEGFDKERFSELLRGKIAESTIVGRVNSTGEIQHRPGWDATLSAPKSVSVMALVAGDERIIDAHHDAVAKTIKYLEDNATFCRENDGKWLKTDNLTVASFTHSASRNLDPQLHTHNVILNITQDKTGRWRSLEPKAIYKQQKLAGAVYRSYLAHTLSHELGYEIESKENGLFEIAGVPPDLVKEMSSRRAEIVRIAKEKGYEDAKGKEQAALMTRSAKRHATKASLDQAWQELAKDHLHELEALIPGSAHQHQQADKESERGNRSTIESRSDNSQGSTRDGNSQSILPTEAALYDIRLAIKHLTTYEAVISKDAIMEFALQNISGSHSYEHLEAALKYVLQEKEIIPSLTSTSQYDRESSYTTPDAWRRESLALKLMEQGKGLFKKPVLRPRAIESHIKHMRDQAAAEGGAALNAGQAEGLRLILGTKDQFVGIQGFAGTGKTFMWSEARQLAESARYTVRGFAPTGSAAEKLMEDSGIRSQTIDSFLYKNRDVLENRRGASINGKSEIWVVDEAGLSNARHVLDMMMLARKAGARIVFQGDGAQLSAIEWGKLFKLLQENGMKTAILDEIMRQKDLEVREAVYSVLNKDYHKAMAHLGDRVQVHEDRITPLVDDLMQLPKEDREKALVVIPDLETRGKVTTAIRSKLLENGELSQADHKASLLKDAKLSDPQKGDGRFYREGMVVQFGKDFPSLGAKKGDRFTVAKNGTINQVVLTDEHGRSINWDPAVGGSAHFAVDVFRQESIELAIGDRIKWTKTLKDIAMRNGDAGRVVAVDKEHNTMTVEWKKGDQLVTRTHDLNKERHFDHDYVHTAFLSQGLDSRHVFTIAESWRRNLVNEKSFYVKLSRTKDKITVYTDDKAKLAKAIARQADKTSALESQLGRRHTISRKTPELNWIEKLMKAAKERVTPDLERQTGSKHREVKPAEHQPNRGGHEIGH